MVLRGHTAIGDPIGSDRRNAAGQGRRANPLARDIDFAATVAAFNDAALDASRWTVALDTIARQTGGYGACLNPMRGVIPDRPSSESLAEVNAAYARDGWWQRDARVLGAPRMIRDGAATDLDALPGEAIARHPYWQEWLAPHGLQWCAAVKIQFGEELWAVTIQRTIAQGPPDPAEVAVLGRLSEHLSASGALSRALGFARLDGAMAAFEMSGAAIILIDRFGIAYRVNDAARGLLGGELQITGGRLNAVDPAAGKKIAAAVDGVILGRDPIQSSAIVPIPRQDGRPIVAHFSRPSGAMFDVMGPCYCVVTLVDPDGSPRLDPVVIREVAGLTPAEARLCCALGSKRGLREAAVALGISYETARTHLRTVFEKTETHSQADLLRLLEALSRRSE